MSKEENKIIKDAMNFLYSFFATNESKFIYHNYSYITENAEAFKEIAKAEGIEKSEYRIGLLAVIFKDLGLVDSPDEKINNQKLIESFLEQHPLQDEEKKELFYYIDFLRSNSLPKNLMEEALRDANDIHLAMYDSLECFSLLRIEHDKVFQRKYNELEWLEYCKEYFITHNIYTRYGKKHYGTQRNKNYFDLEKLIDKVKADLTTKKKPAEKVETLDILSDKETEDLFKIAFRNYVALVSVADRKAGLLIQVNSILASVLIAFVFRKIEETPILGIPTGILLISAGTTIFYSILASKPLEKVYEAEGFADDQVFFFGSFDRIDHAFKNVKWPEYSADLSRILGGEKREIFNQLIKETFQVRKVLSSKFGYLNIAYKVFFAGLIITILAFVVVVILKDYI